MLDWEDVRNLRYGAAPSPPRKGGPKVEAVLPCTRMPTEAILGQMRVLADARAAAFRGRFEEVAEQLAELAAAAPPHGVAPLHHPGAASDAGPDEAPPCWPPDERADVLAALARLSEHVASALEHLRECEKDSAMDPTGSPVGDALRGGGRGGCGESRD